nr:glycolipid transfer protein domain-containing protein [Tanacetum cinerariifolium]
MVVLVVTVVRVATADGVVVVVRGVAAGGCCHGGDVVVRMAGQRRWCWLWVTGGRRKSGGGAWRRWVVDWIDRVTGNIFGFAKKSRRKTFPAAAAGREWWWPAAASGICENIVMKVKNDACDIQNLITDQKQMLAKSVQQHQDVPVCDLADVVEIYNTLSEVIDCDVKTDIVKSAESRTLKLRRVRQGLDLISWSLHVKP